MAAETFFGYYHHIRDNIYDFRLRNNEFKKLIILNLAMILAKKLNIEYFEGEDIDSRIKLFKFNGFNERFTIIDGNIEAPIIKIFSDGNHNPYIKITNSEYSPHNISLDYFDVVDKSLLTSLSVTERSRIVEIVPSQHNNKLHLISYSNDQSYSYVKETLNPRPPQFTTPLIRINHYRIANDLAGNEATRDEQYKLSFINGELIFSVPIDEDEFISLYYNCLPTPLVSATEMTLGDQYITQTDGEYSDLSREPINWAIAIDPSLESRDKDDAIRFDSGADYVDMCIYISDVSPYINPNNQYLFDYCAYKQETEYLLNKRYPMIDPSLSEDRLSLMGINKKAIEIKIRYQYIGGIITKDPINVTVRKVKTLTVYHTTYSLLHNNCINVDMSLALLSSPSETNKRKLYQNFIFKPHDIIDLNQIFAEQNPIPVLLDQLQLIHSFYKDIGLVVDTMDKICTFISSDESDNIDHIYEAWIHSLIELTAVEANKYIAMIEYKYYDRLVGGDRPINFTLSQAEITAHLSLDLPDTPKGFYRATDIDIGNNDINNQSQHYYTLVDQSFIVGNYEIIRNDFKISMKANNIRYPRLHKGLNTIFYTHFTSPLRRFCDLAVHNLLFLNYDRRVEDNFIASFIGDTRKKTNGQYLKIYQSHKKLLNYLTAIDYIVVLFTRNVDKYNIYIPTIGNISYDSRVESLDRNLFTNELVQINNIRMLSPFELSFDYNKLRYPPIITENPIFNSLKYFIINTIYDGMTNNYINDIIKYNFGPEILQRSNNELYHSYLEMLPNLPIFKTNRIKPYVCELYTSIYTNTASGRIEAIKSEFQNVKYLFYNNSDQWNLTNAYVDITTGFSSLFHEHLKSQANLTKIPAVKTELHTYYVVPERIHYYYYPSLRILFVQINNISSIDTSYYNNVEFTGEDFNISNKYLKMMKDKYLKYKNKYNKLKNKLTK